MKLMNISDSEDVNIGTERLFETFASLDRFSFVAEQMGIGGWCNGHGDMLEN